MVVVDCGFGVRVIVGGSGGGGCRGCEVGADEEVLFLCGCCG